MKPSPATAITDVTGGRDVNISVAAHPAQDVRIHAFWAISLAVAVIMICGTLVTLKIIDVVAAVLISSGAIGASAIGSRAAAKLGAAKAPAIVGTAALTAIVPTTLFIARHYSVPPLGNDVVLLAATGADRLANTHTPMFLEKGNGFAVPERGKKLPSTAPRTMTPGYGYEFEPDNRNSDDLPDPTRTLVTADGDARSSIPTGAIVDGGGRLPPESIQRIVRFNYPALNSCFPISVSQATTSLRLVIHPKGHVEAAHARLETIVEQNALAVRAAKDALGTAATCIARRLLTIAFPASDGGLITVVQPYAYSTRN